ncbi:hypothetical protein BC828DRAFT_133060, partial [Blastocladiella britannica]
SPSLDRLRQPVWIGISERRPFTAPFPTALPCTKERLIPPELVVPADWRKERSGRSHSTTLILSSPYPTYATSATTNHNGKAIHYNDDLTTTCRASRYRPDRRSNLLMSLLVACNSPAKVPGSTTSVASGGVGRPAISDWSDTGLVVVERVPVVMVSGMCWANVKNRSRSRCKAADDSGAVGTGNPVSVHRAARSNDASFLVVCWSKARTDGCDGKAILLVVVKNRT